MELQQQRRRQQLGHSVRMSVAGGGGGGRNAAMTPTLAFITEWGREREEREAYGRHILENKCRATNLDFFSASFSLFGIFLSESKDDVLTYRKIHDPAHCLKIR